MPNRPIPRDAPLHPTTLEVDGHDLHIQPRRGWRSVRARPDDYVKDMMRGRPPQPVRQEEHWTWEVRHDHDLIAVIELNDYGRWAGQSRLARRRLEGHDFEDILRDAASHLPPVTKPGG